MANAAKIVLKSTTKLSLNERFTAYRQQVQTSTVNTIRQKVQQQRQASLKNLRLAQQMANRPSVLAALKLKKRSLKQRLGPKGGGGGGVGGTQSTGVKSRLSLGSPRQGSRPLQSRLGSRLGRNKGVVAVRGGIRRNRSGSNRGSAGGGIGTSRPGTSPMIKARLGGPGNRPGEGRPSPQDRNFRANQFRKGRGYNRNFRQDKGNFGGQFRHNQRGNRRRNRRGSGGNRRANNRGRTGRGGETRKDRPDFPSKQELDTQLEEYMAKTKGHLDAELEAYMAQADS